MKILALEFSSNRRTAAVLSDSGSVRTASLLGRASDDGDRKVTPLRLIDTALREASIARTEIDRIAIGLGPGSYTGIRSALAVAQGWQLGRSIDIVGIGTSECLAAQTQEKGWFGKVGIVIDAQRKEIYFALYEITKAERRLIAPLRVMDPSKKPAETGDATTFVGPDVTRFFPDGRVLYPDASALGELNAGSSDFVSGEELTPIYMRETAFVKAPPPRILPSL